ncbi:hypothetical protein [Microbacterium sp. P05]|uniref:hypothetical protein n=1 Tax=Microbacterium sp. P05 TaxID=3366948 RepID=UPI0037457D7D
MSINDELRREPGIRAVSSFFGHFNGEDVVVRPADPREPAFTIEVLLTESKATFPPAAPVHEGDLVERSDPRGGVIEYTINRYEFSKDPFGHGNDHWEAQLVEKRHVARRFAEPHIVVNGGVNQLAVGDGNKLQLINQTAHYPAVVSALSEIRNTMPREGFGAGDLAEIEEALTDATGVAQESDKPSAVKRALHAVNGVIGDLAGSAKSGAADSVKAWAAAATAVILRHIAGL